MPELLRYRTDYENRLDTHWDPRPRSCESSVCVVSRADRVVSPADRVVSPADRVVGPAGRAAGPKKAVFGLARGTGGLPKRTVGPKLHIQPSIGPFLIAIRH